MSDVETVLLRHPVTGGVFEAVESQVGILKHSGWVEAERPAPPRDEESGEPVVEVVAEAPAAVEQSEPEKTSARSSRRKTEES